MPRYSKDELQSAIQLSDGYAGTLRLLGLCQTGGNNEVLKKWITLWGLDISHFLSPSERAKRNRSLQTNYSKPIEDYLILNRDVNGNHLKRKLYQAGLRVPLCELCGQDEMWRGKRMSLILDHINGVHNDNRLENLRIVCPNCNATLDTHCGRKNRVKRRPGSGNHHKGVSRLSTRRVERPPYDLLTKEIAETSYSAVGRKYGVSDNAIRKWKKFYESGGK